MTIEELKSKKITLATLKSFIRKNESLFVEHQSNFDGTVDGVVAVKKELIPVTKENAIGFKGVYCVGSGRDYLSFIETSTHYGIRVLNCCGCSHLYTSKKNQP